MIVAERGGILRIPFPVKTQDLLVLQSMVYQKMLEQI